MRAPYSGAVQVLLLGSGQVWLGSAPVTLPDVNASNGVVHILGGILAASPGALNESSISVASSLGDFGPFNYSQVNLKIYLTSITVPGWFKKLKCLNDGLLLPGFLFCFLRLDAKLLTGHLSFLPCTSA